MKHLIFRPAETASLRTAVGCGLAERLGLDLEAAAVERLIRQGSVYRAKVRLKEPGAVIEPTGGDLEIFYPELPIVEFQLDPAAVVWQDEHLLVVDKPAGVNTAPSPFSDVDCLTWGVQNYLGPGFPISAVHRLDRDTSGLILFAKHKAAELALHSLFRDRAIRKVYRATTPALSAATRSVYRWRDGLDWRGKLQTAATTAILADGTGADWHWTVLPHTGRPHQIRKHFAFHLAPLVGDRAYGDPLDPRPLGLRCQAYRFRHPITGRRLSIALPN